MKILIVEDDPRLRRTLARALELEGYTVQETGDGEEGAYFLEGNTCDLAILDRMLPLRDGVSLLQDARRKQVATPVLMLSAMNAVGDRVTGLDAGADDYLTKPFEMEELLARVRALIRRPAPIEADEILRYGDIEYHPVSQGLAGPAGRVSLSNREGDLLELFLRAGGDVITRHTIFNRVWGPACDVEESNIATYIHFLRRRLAAVGSAVQFINHRGVGFSMAAPAERADAE